VEAEVFVVLNKNDGGQVLRQAMLNANNTPGKDTIAFNVRADALQYCPRVRLPSITIVVIDGTTQPGYGGEPLVGIVGSNAGSANGLELQGRVRSAALVINRFLAAGLSSPAAATSSPDVISARPRRHRRQGNQRRRDDRRCE